MSFGRRGKWSHRWQQWRQRIVDIVVYPWHAIVNSCTWAVQTTGQAWNSRHLRYMIQGLPAVFATVGALVLAVGVLGQDRPNLAATYYMEAGRALANQQFDLATTFCEKAIELNGPLPEYKFFMAIALNAEAEKKPEQAFQKRNRAIAIAKSLAPNDRTGHPPAHLWLGDAIGRLAPLNADTLRMRENQYIRAYTGALERDPKKFADVIKQASERLGWLYWTTQRPAEAEKYLLRVADEKALFKVFLGEYYRTAGRNEESQRMFDSAMETFRKKLETNVDDHESRLGLVQALVHQQKLDEAIQELRNGLTIKPNDPAYTQGIAQLIAVKESELARQPGASIAERLGLLQAGLAVMPANGALLSRLFQLSELKGEEGEKSKKLMQDMLADGKAAPILHFLLGQRAYVEGKLADAQNHWEQAYKLDPKFGFVANNLAWLMAQQKDADRKSLETALDIINGTIKQMGPGAAFRGTRGEILAKLEKYQDAIPDLVAGIGLTKDNLNLNVSLLTAYEKVGNTTMADIQRRKVEELKTKNAKPMMPETSATDAKAPDASNPPVQQPPTNDSPTSTDPPAPKR